MNIGLTGGIKSGKSTVGDFWSKMGAEVVSADKLGHDLLMPETKTAEEVIKLFGENILDSDRKINRTKVRKIVFTEEESLKKFNNIIHPVLTDRIRNILNKNKSSLAIDAALIFEWGLEKEFDVIVTVEAPETIRRNRVKELGWSDAEISGCMESQYPESHRLKYADFIIDNNSTLEVLEKKSIEIWNKLYFSQ